MSRRSDRLRAGDGFTLVELLVVIAIIGILVALLLPAIQAAREAARRAQCQSNMKNVALAVLNYESATQKYPVGFVPQPPSVESWGWAVFVLPYLEQQSIYDRLRPSPVFVQPVDGTRTGPRNLADVFVAGQSNPAEIVPLQTPLPVFRCPSDGTPALVPCDQGNGQCNVINPPARYMDTELFERSFLGMNSKALTPRFLPSASNYVGNRGMIDAGCPGNGSPPNWKFDKAICDSNGVFFGDSEISSKKISDGTSKTFMIGERDKFCLAGTWIGARNPENGSEIHSSLWTVAHVAIPLNFPTSAAYESCAEGFSSAHPGGGMFAFCDGSVRWIDDDISSDLANNSKNCLASQSSPFRCRPTIANKQIGVYQRLAWRNDELPVEGY